AEGDDQEADHIVDEQPDIHGRGAGLPGCGERSVVLAVQRDEDAAEVDSAGTTPIGGVMISSTSDLTMVEKAAPIMMPTAMSITLPRSANSLNSFRIAIACKLPFSSGPQLAMFGRQSKSGRWSG